MNANNILYETALKQFDTVAVSDVSGGAYNPKGILVPYLMHHLKEKMSWSVRLTGCLRSLTKKVWICAPLH